MASLGQAQYQYGPIEGNWSDPNLKTKIVS